MARTTVRTPIPAKMRAKQFMMFDAMKGLTEVVAEKERPFYPQKELTEDRIAELNGKLLAPRIGGQGVPQLLLPVCKKIYSADRNDHQNRCFLEDNTNQ